MWPPKEFILAAALDGLVDRFIWVFPTWDSKGPKHRHNRALVEKGQSTWENAFMRCIQYDIYIHIYHIYMYVCIYICIERCFFFF